MTKAAIAGSIHARSCGLIALIAPLLMGQVSANPPSQDHLDEVTQAVLHDCQVEAWQFRLEATGAVEAQAQVSPTLGDDKIACASQDLQNWGVIALGLGGPNR